MTVNLKDLKKAVDHAVDFVANDKSKDISGMRISIDEDGAIVGSMLGKYFTAVKNQRCAIRINKIYVIQWNPAYIKKEYYNDLVGKIQKIEDYDNAK